MNPTSAWWWLLGVIWMTCIAPIASALESSQEAAGANLGFAHTITTGVNMHVGILDVTQMGIMPGHHLGLRLQEQVNFHNLSAGDEPLQIEIGEDSHETLVANVLAGDHPVYHGTASGAFIYNAAIGDDYASMQAASAWLAAIGVPLINLSAGWGSNDNGASDRERYFDWFARAQETLIVKSAGNNVGQITDPGGFYNGITVGMCDEATQGRQQSSSYQLTDSLEGRGKPEILAPGASITDGVSYDGFPFTGTSFAAPHVTGTAALLMELGAEQLGAPMGHLATKALILNAARKRGVNEPQAGMAQSFDYSANHASNDRDYLAADGVSYATGTIPLTKAWTPTSWAYNGTTFSTTRPLDDEQGVGLLDTSRAVINLLGGRQTPGDVSGIGWDFGTLSLSETATYTLAQAIPAGNFLTATVVWDRIVSEVDGDGVIEVDDEYVFQELANLDLRLRDGMGTIVAQSISNADNLQHLHVPITASGTVGDYSLEVVYDGGGVLPTDYALAWWVGSEGLQPGDYNYDGVVDMGDYDSWRGSFAQASMSREGFAAGDGNGDGMIDARDYVMWRDRAGSTFVGGWSGSAIPEPRPLVLLAVLILSAIGVRACQTARDCEYG